MLREYDAVCVTSAADVRELCGAASDGTMAAESADPERVRVLDALSARTALPTVEIARRSGLSVERVLSQLGLMELEGVVHPMGGGWRRSPS